MVDLMERLQNIATLGLWLTLEYNPTHQCFRVTIGDAAGVRGMSEDADSAGALNLAHLRYQQARYQYDHRNDTPVNATPDPQKLLDRIAFLEDVMRRVAALGVKGVQESSGSAVGRMVYMRDSLIEAVDHENTHLLKMAEQMYTKEGL